MSGTESRSPPPAVGRVSRGIDASRTRVVADSAPTEASVSIWTPSESAETSVRARTDPTVTTARRPRSSPVDPDCVSDVGRPMRNQTKFRARHSPTGLHAKLAGTQEPDRSKAGPGAAAYFAAYRVVAEAGVAEPRLTGKAASATVGLQLLLPVMRG